MTREDFETVFIIEVIVSTKERNQKAQELLIILFSESKKLTISIS